MMHPEAQRILEADDRPILTVTVPEWGMDVRLRLLTANQRDLCEQLIGAPQGRPVRAVVVGLALCGPDGQPLFDDPVATLGRKSALVLDRLFELVLTQSRIGMPALDPEDGEPLRIGMTDAQIAAACRQAEIIIGAHLRRTAKEA